MADDYILTMPKEQQNGSCGSEERTALKKHIDFAEHVSKALLSTAPRTPVEEIRDYDRGQND